MIRLGDIVLFRAPKLQNETESKSFPAIVYKLHPHSLELGLTVFFEGIPTRYGKIGYSLETESCWRHLDAIT